MLAADRCGSQWIVADQAVDRFEIPRCLMKLASLIRLGHYKKTKPAMAFAKVRAGNFFPNEIESWVNSAVEFGWMPSVTNKPSQKDAFISKVSSTKPL